METFDAALVLGRGISDNGSIPESAKATVKKAAELFSEGRVKNVIFSGKWEYDRKTIPPTTEAEALASFAKAIGVPEDIIRLETESTTTAASLCNIKDRFLEPKGWKRVILVAVDPPAK